jgi:hypothetical protein
MHTKVVPEHWNIFCVYGQSMLHHKTKLGLYYDLLRDKSLLLLTTHINTESSSSCLISLKF